MIKDEFIDENLQKFGVRFHDATQEPAQMPEFERPEPANKEKAVNAQREPVPKYVPNWYDRLKGCVKWVTICGGISSLLLFFQINELMAAEAAVPCICVCTTLAGFGVGKHTAEGRKGT